MPIQLADMDPPPPRCGIVDMKGQPVPEHPHSYYQFRVPARWHHYAPCFLEAPKAVKAFLRTHPDFNKPDWEFMFRCTIHEGEWLVYIDSLAPWHWEQCQCRLCAQESDQKRIRHKEMLRRNAEAAKSAPTG